ncbi:hypothetical protein [Paenibacillus sp. MBLB4367]|uniref:hypothetical protein n=1 Tax=Paenibacillus sp. MBLB4367 TaxID=3384767 RepID=UPI003908085B
MKSLLPSRNMAVRLAYCCSPIFSSWVTNMYRQTDMLPVLKEAYGDPMYDEPQPFYAGQQTRRFFVEIAEKTPAVFFSDDFRALRGIAGLEIYKAVKGVISPEAALQQMETKMNEYRKKK